MLEPARACVAAVLPTCPAQIRLKCHSRRWESHRCTCVPATGLGRRTCGPNTEFSLATSPPAQLHSADLRASCLMATCAMHISRWRVVAPHLRRASHRHSLRGRGRASDPGPRGPTHRLNTHNKSIAIRQWQEGVGIGAFSQLYSYIKRAHSSELARFNLVCSAPLYPDCAETVRWDSQLYSLYCHALVRACVRAFLGCFRGAHGRELSLPATLLSVPDAHPRARNTTRTTRRWETKPGANTGPSIRA